MRNSFYTRHYGSILLAYRLYNKSYRRSIEWLARLYKPGTSYIYEFNSKLFLISIYLKGSILKYQLEQEMEDVDVQLPESEPEESSVQTRFFCNLNTSLLPYDKPLLLHPLREDNKLPLFSTTKAGVTFNFFTNHPDLVKTNDHYSLSIF